MFSRIGILNINTNYDFINISDLALGILQKLVPD